MEPSRPTRRRIATRWSGTPTRPTPRALLNERAHIRETVIACGVAREDVEDVTSTCLVEAWDAIQRGNFRLYSRVDPGKALRAWLRGISWRQSMHERNRAHHWREVLSGDPWTLAPALTELDLEDEIAARAGLRAWWALPSTRRALLLAVALGETPTTLAEPLGVTARAVNAQFHRAREQLRAAVMTGEANGGEA